MRELARSLVVTAAVAGVQLVDDPQALLLAVLGSTEFGLLLMTFGIATIIWLRMDYVENDKEQGPDDEEEAGPLVLLPHQRVSVEEGAS